VVSPLGDGSPNYERRAHVPSITCSASAIIQIYLFTYIGNRTSRRRSSTGWALSPVQPPTPVDVAPIKRGGSRRNRSVPSRADADPPRRLHEVWRPVDSLFSHHCANWCAVRDLTHCMTVCWRDHPKMSRNFKSIRCANAPDCHLPVLVGLFARSDIERDLPPAIAPADREFDTWSQFRSAYAGPHSWVRPRAAQADTRDGNGQTRTM